MPVSETFIFLPGNLARPKPMVGSSVLGWSRHTSAAVSGIRAQQGAHLQW